MRAVKNLRVSNRRAPIHQQLSSRPDAYTCAGQIVDEYLSLPGAHGREDTPEQEIACCKPRRFPGLRYRRYASRSAVGALADSLAVRPRQSPTCTYAGRTFPEDTQRQLAVAA
jgi:hypothetical protein